jgi:tetratricopeptide (TPR) repeat protein
MFLGLFYAVAADYYRASTDIAAAMQLCESGLAIATSIGNMKRQSQALRLLALIKKDCGKFSEAMEHASDSQRLAKLCGDLDLEAAALHIEAYCWQYHGGYTHSISLLDRAAHLLELCGMSGGALHCDIQNGQAEVHRCKSEYVEARIIQIHILHDSPADHNPYSHAIALLNIAQIDVEAGGPEHDVWGNIDAAGMIFERVNYSTGLAYCEMFRAALDIREGRQSAARRLFEKCLQSAWGKDPEAVKYCLEKVGAGDQWGPGNQMSFLWTVTFLVHSVKSKLRLELHKALQYLGDAFQTQGHEETAISLLTVALDGFTQMDVHCSKAECMVRLGDISKLNGDELKAVELWETARPLFQRSSQMRQLAHLDEKLAHLGQAQFEEVQQ